MTLDDCPHLGHHLIVGNARFRRRHRLLDLGAEPRVIGFGLFGRREFGLDGRELGHGGNIALRVWRGKKGARKLIRNGDASGGVTCSS